MADKKLVFQLEVDGVTTLEELRASIKATNEELARAKIGGEEYRKLEQQLGALKNVQKDVADSARLAQTALTASAENGGRTYRQLNAELVTARALFKELTEEERRGQVGQNLIADIKRLDAELKDIDASIGQFQRNVGDYSGGIQDAFAKIAPTINQAIPGFGQLTDAANLVNEGIGQIGQTAGATGKLLTGAFIAFQVGGLILDGIQQVGEFTDEIIRLRGEIGRLSGESEQAVDAATAEVEAIRATFGAGTDETIQAANALNKAFSDIDFQGALGLIEQGFLSGADSSGELLDVLKEYPRLFDQMGFSAEEFIAIQAKATQEGVFSDKGVDAIKEFGIRIREQTVATRTSLEQAFGPEFTKNLFDGINSGAITVKDALVQVSGKLKETELPAKQLQQVISDVFGGPGEDAGDKFLKSLSDIDQGLDGAIDQTNEYTQRLNAQLEAERELAAAKVEVSKQLTDLTGGYKNLGTNIETFGVKAFGRFLDAIQPIRQAFGRLTDSVVGLLRQIGLIPEEGEKSAGALDILTGVLNGLGFVLGVVVDYFGAVIRGFTLLIRNIPIVNGLFNAAGATIRFVLDLIANFPAYFAGAVEGAKQFASNVADFFRKLVIDAQILFAELQKINPFNENDAELDRQIKALNGRKSQIEAAGKTVAEAFKAGFDSVKPPEAKVKTPGSTAVEISPDGTTKTKGGTTTPGQTSEQLKAQKKLNDDSLAAQEKYNDQRIALLNELSKRLADATIEGINDETARRIAAENQKYEAIRADILAQETKLVEDQKAAREKIVAASGENSPQAQAFDAQAAADLEAQREAARALTEQNEKNHLDRLNQIREDAANNEARQELERIKASLEERARQFDAAALREETRIQAQIARILQASGLSSNEKQELVLKLTFQADSAALQQESIKVLDQIEAIEEQLRALSQSDTLQQASIGEFNFLSDQLDALYNKRATLERQYTEVVNSESERRQQAKFKEVEDALGTALQIVQIADQFAAASAQREIANIQEKEEARKASIQKIQTQLQTATGIEKANLELRLKNEQDGLKKLEAERAKVEKEEAKRQKAFAIIQAIISTAAAVAKTLGTLGVPAGIPAAILAGALGAAQIAVIAAQPAATGGVIGLHEQRDGLVVAAQNIPQMRNGDNVLATLRRGEVVLNRQQQAALGGAPTFRAIKVPGFAVGGAAGDTIAAPNVAGTGSAERIRLLEELSRQTVATLESVNARIDRIRVFVVSQDVRDDLDNGDTLEAAAVLSPE